MKKLLMLVALFALISCTAAQKAMWADLGKGALTAVAAVAADSACAAAALKCEDYGGAMCVSMVKQGCHMGRARMMEALTAWRSKGTAPDPAKVQLEVRAALSSDAGLVAYKARMAPIMKLESAISPKGKNPVSNIGFKVPTTATGGAGVTDSKPVEIK